MIGLIGKKAGMTQLFSEDNKVIPITMIIVEPNIVICRKTNERDGYSACVLGVGVKNKPNRPYSGLFKLQGVKPTRVLREIRNPPLDWETGKQITASIFPPSSKVEITAYSKGRGFAGVVKRHGFSGGPGGHGSKHHARPGSVGCSKSPAMVVKGHPLPGRMGGDKVTRRGVEVVKLDESKGLLFLKGQVPGAKNSLVLVKCK